MSSLVPHALKMKHGQLARVKEPLGTVGHAALLSPVELAALDVACDALGEAHICERVHSCESGQ